MLNQRVIYTELFQTYLKFAAAFLLGVLVTGVVIIQFNVHSGGQSSVGNINQPSTVLSTVNKLRDDIASQETSQKSVKTSADSERKRVFIRSTSKHFEKPANEQLAGCETVLKDNTFVARRLRQQIRILCYIQTIPETRTRYVKNTWGKRCDVLLFGSDYRDDKFPTMNITVPHGRDYLATKTKRAFDNIYANHRDDADWFITCDDETYVIMENLRYMLSQYDPQEALMFGHAFVAPEVFFSGASGYVFSREALNRFGRRPTGYCRKDDTDEDVMMSMCLESLGVKLGDSCDSQGRSRFNPSTIKDHITGQLTDWMHAHNQSQYKKDMATLSDYPVSFHHVKDGHMLQLEYFLYHANVYGIVGGLQSVNPKDPHSRVARTILN